MQKKVEQISGRISKIISNWDGTEAIVLGEAAEIKTIDPYFNINLDVYYTGNLPPSNDRKQAFNEPAAFNSTRFFPEDRFLIKDLPVRICYQETGRFDLLLKRIDEKLWVFRESGTNLFYRIVNGQVLFRKNGWLDSVRNRLSGITDHFWNVILERTKISISYHLNDLHAAVFRNDSLFYVLALAGFLRSASSFLLALNHNFEPSGRMLYEKVKTLPIVPDEFAGRFESLLRDDPELPADRKREIAELLAKSIIAMA